MIQSGIIYLLVNEKAKEVFDTGLFKLHRLYENGKVELIDNKSDLGRAIVFDGNIGIEVGSIGEMGETDIVIGSLDPKDYSDETKEYLKEFIVYEDKDDEDGEHIYSQFAAKEEMSMRFVGLNVQREIEMIYLLAEQRGYSYVRFIK